MAFAFVAPSAASAASCSYTGGSGGRVGEIGIGDPRLSTTAKSTKRFLNAWKIG